MQRFLSATIYATLYSYVNGTWKSNATTYTSAGPAALSSPTPGSTLASSTQIFTWTKGGGVTSYKLILGTTVGGSDLFNSYTTTATTATAKNLPITGGTIYARLYSQISGVWLYNDSTYTAK